METNHNYRGRKTVMWEEMGGQGRGRMGGRQTGTGTCKGLPGTAAKGGVGAFSKSPRKVLGLLRPELIFNSVLNTVGRPQAFRPQSGQQRFCFSFVSNQSRIEEIKIKRAETADSVIRLQFRMEQQVYCQDQIYSRLLEKAREDANSLGKTASLQFPLSNDVASVSSITEIGVHLNAYFLVSAGARGSAVRRVPARVPAGAVSMAVCWPSRAAVACSTPSALINCSSIISSIILR